MKPCGEDNSGKNSHFYTPVFCQKHKLTIPPAPGSQGRAWFSRTHSVGPGAAIQCQQSRDPRVQWWQRTFCSSSQGPGKAELLQNDLGLSVKYRSDSQRSTEQQDTAKKAFLYHRVIRLACDCLGSFLTSFCILYTMRLPEFPPKSCPLCTSFTRTVHCPEPQLLSGVGSV